METTFLVPTSLSDGGCVCVTGLPLEGTNTHPVSPWCELGLREALLSSAVCTDQTQAETEPHCGTENQATLISKHTTTFRDAHVPFLRDL